jgi:1-phosphatidylinositol-3-phosphate 5-kinase
MDPTATRASILAKLLGFYTVEVRNLDTGTVQAKADLLVIENLFYSQKLTKTFDLKGIQGRKVKAGSNSAPSKTLFDGEWIEGKCFLFYCIHLELTTFLLYYCRPTTRSHTSQPRFQSDLVGSYESGL